MGKNKRCENNEIFTHSSPSPKKMKKSTDTNQKAAKKQNSENTDSINNSVIAKSASEKQNPVKSHQREVYLSSGSSSCDNESGKHNIDSDSGTDSDSNCANRPQGNSSRQIGDTAIKNSVTAAPVNSSSSVSESYHSDTEEEDKKRRKKQKELLKMQRNKKGRKLSPKKQGVPVIKRELEMDSEDSQSTSTSGVTEWPRSDLEQLLKRIKKQLPPGDEERCDSKAASLNWRKISFGNYTPPQCNEMWNSLSGKVRKYRTLEEVLADVLTMVSTSHVSKDKNEDKHTSMYNKFYLKKKDEIAREHPDLDSTQVVKIISEQFKNLTDKEREVYKEKGSGKKVGAAKESSKQTVNTGQGKNSRKKLEPKKPRPPFKLYLEEQLAKNLHNTSDKKMIEESCKKKWKNWKDDKKALWINRSLEDLERYKREVKLWKELHPDYVAPDFTKSLLNREERLIRQRVSGRPVKPPMSAYSLYSKTMLQKDVEVKSRPPKERMVEISRKWKELPQEMRDKYDAEVKEMQRNYQINFKKFLDSLSPEDRQMEENMLQKKKKNKATSSNNIPNKKQRAVKSEPKTPPSKPYDLFLQEFIKKKPADCSRKERLKQAPSYWEKMPDSEKSRYKKEFKTRVEKYLAKFQSYLTGVDDESLQNIFQLCNARKSASLKEDSENENNNDDDDEEDEDDDDDGGGGGGGAADDDGDDESEDETVDNKVQADRQDSTSSDSDDGEQTSCSSSSSDE